MLRFDICFYSKIGHIIPKSAQRYNIYFIRASNINKNKEKYCIFVEMQHH